MLNFLLLALFTTAPAAAPATRVATPVFETLVRHADVIAIGTVVGVHELPGDPGHASGGLWREESVVRVAQLALERTFKNEGDLTRVFFLAEPTWTCDDTRAVEGETAFFLLQRNAKFFARTSERFRRASSDLVGEVGLFQIVHSGRGRMEIEGDRVRSGAIFPRAFVLTQHPEARGEFLTRVRRSEFERLIEQTVLAQDRPWIEASATALGSALPWELAVHFDRRAHLVVDGPGGRTETRWTIPSAELVALERRLREDACRIALPDERASEPDNAGSDEPMNAPDGSGTGEPAARCAGVVLGRHGAGGLERRIAVLPRLDVTLLELPDGTGATPEAASLTQCALALWREARTLLSDPDLLDGRDDARGRPDGR